MKLLIHIIIQPIGEWDMSSKLKIAQTIDEFMRMCMSDDKTQEECIDTDCPVCLQKFIFKRHLIRPVTFHKTKNSQGKDIWSCPMHPEEQLRMKQGRKFKCAMCRTDLFISQVQLDNIKSQEQYLKDRAATTIQRMTRKTFVTKAVSWWQKK